MTSVSRVFAVLLIGLTAACAPKARPAAAPQPDIADELVRQGCYDCLLEARTAYERSASTSQAAMLRLAEVNLLLALREKELSLDPAPSIERARMALASVRGFDGRPLIAAVEALPEDANGRRLLPVTGPDRDALATMVSSIDSSPISGVTKEYLKLSLQCGRVALENPPAIAPGDPPLLAYRRAICDNPIRVPPLQDARKAVPRFVETSFFIGRSAIRLMVMNGSEGREVRELFEEAYARFPDSPSIAYNLATVYQATGDCRRAEEFFTKTLDRRMAHEEARLGRAICRTYLSKNDEAIADATVLIDANAGNRADAYYWRAWNHRHQARLGQARSDIDAARGLRYNAQVLTLAGMIEHDQKEFEVARTDLQRARDLDQRQCDARWYLGLVGYATEQWAPAAAGFAEAADCYDRSAREIQERRDQMARRTDISEDFRTRQLAGFDAALAEDSSQRSAAELNAAVNYGRAGDLSNATVYMKRAWNDPQRRLVIEDLRQVLGVPRW